MKILKRILGLSILITLVMASLAAAGPGGAQGKADLYYFKSLGILDDGPPYFVITEKHLWDKEREFSGEPVPESILPEGFWLNDPSVDSVTYRYDGPTDQGRQILEDDRHFKENLELDQAR